MPGRVFVKGGKIERIEKRLDDPAKILAKIGVAMVAESQRAFKAQRFGRDQWEPRAPVNVFGILSDFAAGKTKPPARRLEQRPALRDTGRLASSIAYQVRGDTVEVGTSVEYAAVHQEGGETESVPVNAQVRRALWKWLKTQSTQVKRQIGWVLNKKFRDQRLKQRVPARPFIGVTAETRVFVRKIVGVEIAEV
jgi:phage gpG-like protein